MSRNEIDIHDDELRVIGQNRTFHTSDNTKPKRYWWWIAAVLLVCGIIASVFLFSGKEEEVSELMYVNFNE